MSAITQMQAVEILQDHIKNIEPFRVVFALKKMRVKPLRTSTVNLMMVCISIYDHGLPITTGLVSAIMNCKVQSVTGRLHTLGDKKCLLLKRRKHTGRGAPLEWVLDPLFLEVYR